MIRAATLGELFRKGFVQHDSAEQRLAFAYRAKCIAQRCCKDVRRYDFFLATAVTLRAFSPLCCHASNRIHNGYRKCQPKP